jgi:Pentapeptide repeats (8 copies)
MSTHPLCAVLVSVLSALSATVEASVPRCAGEVDGVYKSERQGHSGRRAQRLNRQSSTRSVRAEAALRYTPCRTHTTAARLRPDRSRVIPCPPREVPRRASWRRKSARSRLHARRSLAYLYAGLFAAVLVVWSLPSLLTRHPRVGDAAARHTAITNTRTGLVATLAVLGAGVGLAYTARTYRLSREGHLTDRYTKAVEQLGSDKIEVRLGGIYALERLMRDSPADQPTIVEVLAAYIRQHAPPASLDEAKTADSPTLPSSPDADVQAALTVLGRRTAVAAENPIDLIDTHLAGADAAAKLRPGQLGRANLAGAQLMGANLAGAQLMGANLAGAQLMGANLTGAHLIGAYLTRAWLGGANLAGAHLSGANLAGAHLSGVNLAGAQLGANLAGAHVTRGALTEEQLAEASNVELIEWVEKGQL